MIDVFRISLCLMKSVQISHRLSKIGYTDKLVETINLVRVSMIRPFSYFQFYPSWIKRHSILESLLFLVLLSSSTFASNVGAVGQFYRYQNENGQLVLTQTLPAEYADKGYDILNDKGRLIKSVPPALTAEEIKIRDEQIERERLARIEKQKQAEKDEELQQLYSEPNDAVRVLNRKFIDIQSIIGIKESRIQNLRTQIIDQESRAAERQRKGYSVSEEALEKLRSLKKDIENTHIEIKELYVRLDSVLIEFDEKIKRLETITQHQATDYPEVLESINNFRPPKEK